MCGVAGVLNVPQAAISLRTMLHALQNRGRDGCGIFATEEGGSYRSERFKGAVASNFTGRVLEKLAGNQGVGHTRYATAKNSGGRKNLQPLYFQVNGQPVAIAHNGNFTNIEELEATVLEGTPFTTASDTERFLRLTLRERRSYSWTESIGRALSKMQGSCSAVMFVPGALFAIRDASGCRPLYWGKKDDGYVVASETCALDAIDVFDWQEVPPASVMSFSKNGVVHFSLPKSPLKMCTFELVYFAFPTSTIHGISVRQIRVELGRALFDSHPIKTDLVIGIPDSAIEMSSGYASGHHNAADNGVIMRRHDTGRTFTLRSQAMREKAVSEKFAFETSSIRGKTITLVDDSLVRGTTSRGISEELRKRGAKEVHWRIPSPKTIASCLYGINTADSHRLLAATHSHEEMRDAINADSLEFLSLEDFQSVLTTAGLPKDNGCFACMTGEYWHERGKT